MKPIHSSLIPLFSLVLLTPNLLSKPVTAVEYRVTNRVPELPGGKRFDSEIGSKFTLKQMPDINAFIWRVFEQPSPSQRKKVPILNVYITNLTDGAIAETGQDNVYFSELALRDFPEGSANARSMFIRVMYHEMTHIFQWSGQGTAPGGLTEGVAEYVVLKAGLIDPSAYTKPGEGERWDEGYGVTARFLEYCDSLKLGFTAALNNMIRDVYSDDCFRVLLGKPLDQLWREYKAKYGRTDYDLKLI